MTEKASETASAGPSDATSKLESQLKTLMTITGATSPPEVLQRFIAQKESSSRLCYLRTVTEGEKKHLETHRDELMSHLETSKFADIKESEMYVSTSTTIDDHFYLIFGFVAEIKNIWKS